MGIQKLIYVNSNKENRDIKTSMYINMKHAYLIMAHNNLEILKVLVCMLDDERNDIYIHIDKKSKMLDNIRLSTKYAKLNILQNRIDVRWGAVSQIQLEYLLFKTANDYGPYQYYHLLSGVDLPIKSQDYIHHFMNKHHGSEFIGFAQGINLEKEIYAKVVKYHFLDSNFKSKNIFIKIVRFLLEEMINYTIKRKSEIIFKKGAGWVSITQQCVDYLLSKEEWVLKRFKRTCCGDEIYKQTLIFNNPILLDKVYSTTDEFNGCLREIDWKRDSPWIWKESDKNTLLQSNKLFARKFDAQDMRIVEWIKNTFS